MADAEDLKSRQALSQHTAPKRSTAKIACVYAGLEHSVPFGLCTFPHDSAKRTGTTTDTGETPKQATEAAKNAAALQFQIDSHTEIFAPWGFLRRVVGLP